MLNITPIEQVNNFFFKRDDYYVQYDVCGGKVRSAYKIITENINNYITNFSYQEKVKGFTTAGSKQSPQIIICATICENLKIPFVAHTPSGKLSKEFEKIINYKYTTIAQHKAGYNSVIIKRAKDYALENNFYYIPFGMECNEAIEETSKQVTNILEYKDFIKRIVCPIGSGMSFLGIVKGLYDFNINIPLLGIQVGADYKKRFEKFNINSYTTVNYEILKTNEDYHTYIKSNKFSNIELDPIYEAKCIPFLKEGDLLWIVGKR